MICIGRIEKSKFKTIIKPVYKNYKDIKYDVTLAKSTIIDFIMTTHFMKKWYTTNPDDYRLNLCPLYGLKLSRKFDDDITFYICVKSGNVYT